MKNIDFKSLLLGIFMTATIGLSVNATTESPQGLDEYEVKRLIKKMVNGADVYIWSLDVDSGTGWGEVEM